MAEPIPIDEWSTCFDPRETHGQYRPPEARSLCLQGEAPKHPRRPGRIITSPIVAVDGRLVTTESGTIYRLGKPDEAFRKWNEERGKPLDPEQPLPNGVRR